MSNEAKEFTVIFTDETDASVESPVQVKLTMCGEYWAVWGTAERVAERLGLDMRDVCEVTE